MWPRYLHSSQECLGISQRLVVRWTPPNSGKFPEFGPAASVCQCRSLKPARHEVFGHRKEPFPKAVSIARLCVAGLWQVQTGCSGGFPSTSFFWPIHMEMALFCSQKHHAEQASRTGTGRHWQLAQILGMSLVVSSAPPNAGKFPTILGTNGGPCGTGATRQFYDRVNFFPCLMLPRHELL